MKKTIAVLGFAAAALTGVNNAQRNAIENKGISNTKEISTANQQKQQTPAQNKLADNQGQQVKFKNSHNPNPVWNNYGTSPKEWGMYLQRTGRQKWNKKQRA